MSEYPLVDALTAIKNSEEKGKDEYVVSPVSKTIQEVLEIMKKKGYIQGFEKVEDKRGGKVIVNLNGKINNCGAITPRFPVGKDEIEDMEKRFLPAQGFGYLIITTSKGLKTNLQAKKEGVGGSLLAYFY